MRKQALCYWFYKCLLLLGMSASLSLSAQTAYFISPGGNDENPGTIDQPFKTLVHAQELARRISGLVTIYLREGTYYLDNVLVFTPEDGNEGKQLTISGYPGEHVVISGGVNLNLKWAPFQKGIMQAHVHDLSSMDLMTVNGVIRPMARYPNYDSTALRFNGTAADATSPARIKTWNNPAGGFLHAMHRGDWGDFHYRFTGKTADDGLEMEGGWQNNRRNGLSPDNRMVENIFEELDAPGEWYFNSKQSILYYYPLASEDIHTANFEVAQLKHLIEVRGTTANPVKNIILKDLEFTLTNRTFMEHYEPLLRSDWTIYRGGAIFLEGTENCIIQNAYLHNLGGNAVFFSKYNRNSGISGCHLTQIGASAVCFVGDTGALRSPSFEYNEFVPLQKINRAPGPKTSNFPSNCFVFDNLIHNIGLFEKQITGVEISMSQGITVSHNSIYEVPRAGINVSEGTWGGHIIEYNDVFDTVKETGDHGSFNSWGRDRFWHPKRATMDTLVTEEPALILADAMATTVIRNNRFRCDRGWDIDLDDGSSNYRIYDNLCLNGGIKLREGFYRVVENNILVNSTFHPHVWFAKSSDVFTRNIVMSQYAPIQLQGWGEMVDYNLFTDQEALETARQHGTDQHSIETKIDFVNPQKGDFSVEAQDLEVFEMGFQNFPMDKFGVVSPRLKSIAKTPRMPVPIQNQHASGTNAMVWQGWRIKNLETLGERSATGMDSERGIYVVTQVKYDSRMRDFIQANDVILQFAGVPVNNLAELLLAAKQTDLTQPVQMVIFRNQKENVVVIPGNTME